MVVEEQCKEKVGGKAMPKGVFSVNSFAKYSRTTKDTLLHYDRIGLLSPSQRGETGYRYYSPEQLSIVNVIRTLKELGLSLNEIKELIDDRNPENFDATFHQKMEILESKIQELMDTKELLNTLHNYIQEGRSVDESSFSIESLKEAPMFVGEENDYGNNRDDFDALNTFYEEISEKHPNINLNYPIWGLFRKERIIKRDWKWPDRFYFYHPKGDKIRQAGEYAIAYTRGGYGQCAELYVKMLDFIEKQGYEICGDTYEEYILNEICIPNDRNYLIRAMISVQKREE